MARYGTEVYRRSLRAYAILLGASVVGSILTVRNYLRLRDEPIGWVFLFLTMAFLFFAPYSAWRYVKTRRELREGNEEAD